VGHESRLPLAGAATLAVGATCLVLLPQPVPESLEVAVAIPLVLLAPGYAVSAAVLPIGSIRTAERLAMSIGLSLAIAALIGLILNVTPRGLVREAWITAFATVTVASVLIALKRGRGPQRIHASPWQGATLVQAAWFVAALLLFAGAMGIAVIGEQTEPRPAFSELWMLPSTDGQSVTVGIGNRELSGQTYRLQVRVGQEMLYARDDITVPSGHTWETEVALPTGDGRSLIIGEIFLGEDTSRPYREVTMWTSG